MAMVQQAEGCAAINLSQPPAPGRTIRLPALSRRQRPPPAGSRVGLIAGFDEASRSYQVLGYARCHGLGIPTDQAAGTESSRFRRERRQTALFTLEDGGAVVFGTEAYWVKDTLFQPALEQWRARGFGIKEVTPGRVRAALASTCEDDDGYPFPE